LGAIWRKSKKAEMSRIAILGATGFVGTNLTLRLLDMGHEVLALSRRAGSWPLQHKNLSILKCDITRADHLAEALAGIDCVYYLIHGLAESPEDFEFLEAKGASVFARAAVRAKIQKVIYLGGLGPESDLSAHLRSRHLVGEILGLIPAATIEFRASIVLGAQSTSFEMIKALAQRLPVRPYAAWLETPCQPIGMEDLLSYLCAALELQVKGHTVVEIGASEVLPYGELLDLAYKLEGVSRPKFLLPITDQRVLIPLIDVVLPEFSNVGKKLFLSLAYPTVVTDQKAEELFPDIKPQSIEEAMRLAWEESRTQYPAVWEGDFWKEMGEHTLLQTRQGQQQLIDKLKTLAAPYQERLMKRIPGRKKKNEK
jgi:uncharacterized protein YbjT (DUF2867 family)